MIPQRFANELAEVRALVSNTRPIRDRTREGVTTMSRPTIDHGILSPSGHVSSSARRRALERTRTALFGADGLPAPTVPQPSKAASLRRQAADLLDLAARGMRPRAYRQAAAALQARADALDR